MVFLHKNTKPYILVRVLIYDTQKQKHFNKMTGQWEIIETMPMANSILPRTNQTQQPTNYAQKLRNAKQKEKYDIYIKEKRKQQIQQTKQGLQKTGSFLKKMGQTTSKTLKGKRTGKLYKGTWLQK